MSVLVDHFCWGSGWGFCNLQNTASATDAPPSRAARYPARFRMNSQGRPCGLCTLASATGVLPMATLNLQNFRADWGHPCCHLTTLASATSPNTQDYLASTGIAGSRLKSEWRSGLALEAPCCLTSRHSSCGELCRSWFCTICRLLLGWRPSRMEFATSRT